MIFKISFKQLIWEATWEITYLKIKLFIISQYKSSKLVGILDLGGGIKTIIWIFFEFSYLKLIHAIM